MRYQGEGKTRLALLKLFIVARKPLSLKSRGDDHNFSSALFPNEQRELIAAAAPCSVLGGVVPAEIRRKTNTPTPSVKKNW